MNNYCIIMAGGTGRRLWPYSTPQHPKQFIDFFGAGRTLLQMTFDRFCRLMPADHIYISTHTDYVALVREQLPEIPECNILAESTRLSTAPAAAQASRYIRMHDADACVILTPSDQFIVSEDAFTREVTDAFHRLRVTAAGSFLALAVQATHPYTSYGYIQKGENIVPNLYHVKTFTEKPDAEFAEMFVQSDEFLWNTGLFLWHVNTMEHLSDKIFEEVAVQPLDSLLLDTHREEVLVQECAFGWTDVGCWQRMHEVCAKDIDGNAVLGANRVLMEGCETDTVALEPGMEAIIKGLKGYLVACHNGLLVIVPNTAETDIKNLQTKLM